MSLPRIAVVRLGRRSTWAHPKDFSARVFQEGEPPLNDFPIPTCSTSFDGGEKWKVCPCGGVLWVDYSVSHQVVRMNMVLFIVVDPLKICADTPIGGGLVIAAEESHES